MILYTKTGLDAIRYNVGDLGCKIFLSSGFILPFFLGALAFKYKLPELIKRKLNCLTSNRRMISILLVFVLISTRFIFHNQSLQPFGVFVFFNIFPSLDLNIGINRILRFLGKHSIVIWFVHTWFSENLFSRQIYDLYHPILIFGIVLSLSIAISLLIENVCDRKCLIPYRYIKNRIMRLSHQIK